MMSYRLIILVVFFIIVLILGSKRVERFEVKDKPKIWMYWETLPNKKRPEYLDLCFETIKEK